RRRHDVLAAGNAGFVRHEADVDQPHDHDGEEVELLGQDLRVELLRLFERRNPLRNRLREHKDRRNHRGPPQAAPSTAQPYETKRRRSMWASVGFAPAEVESFYI